MRKARGNIRVEGAIIKARVLLRTLSVKCDDIGAERYVLLICARKSGVLQVRDV